MSSDKRSRVVPACVTLALLLAMIVTPVHAQSSTYLILSGRVELDTEDGKPVPVKGALIDVYRLDSGGHWSTLSDKSGYYSILGLPILGRYIVIASGPISSRQPSSIPPAIRHSRNWPTRQRPT